MSLNDWLDILVSFSFVVLTVLQIWQERLHKKEINQLHAVYLEERQQLLDRIMANNIHEFKSMTGQVTAKRSESGNYLVDRMEKSIRKQYPDIE